MQSKIRKGSQKEVIVTRVSTQEKILLQNKMEADGFHNMSQWLRHRLLYSLSTEQQIREIYSATNQIHALLHEEMLKKKIQEEK